MRRNDTVIFLSFRRIRFGFGILFDTLVMGSHCRREVLELHTHYDLSNPYSTKEMDQKELDCLITIDIPCGTSLLLADLKRLPLGN